MGFKAFVAEFRAVGLQMLDARVGCSVCDNDAPSGVYRLPQGMSGKYPTYLMVCRRCYIKAVSQT